MVTPYKCLQSLSDLGFIHYQSSARKKTPCHSLWGTDTISNTYFKHFKHIIVIVCQKAVWKTCYKINEKVTDIIITVMVLLCFNLSSCWVLKEAHQSKKLVPPFTTFFVCCVSRMYIELGVQVNPQANSTTPISASYLCQAELYCYTFSMKGCQWGVPDGELVCG